MNVLLVFTFITLSCLLQNVQGNRTITVPTDYGDILGYETDMARIFYGIPYAQPPLDDLRWNRPVPISKWSPKVLNATTRAPACPQPPCGGIPSILCPTLFSEDCLYLNIFTPLPNNSSSGSRLPVMLFIPGGNFQYLDASIPVYESERLVNTTNVIVALIQYRLGALGFLATGTKPNDLQGNYGILDQRLAIAWIKANIDAFGGDPNQITLFGQSAGAQSVALHHLTIEMQSFFQSSIIQSAPMAIPFRTYDQYITPTTLLAEELQCGAEDISCLRKASYQAIAAAQTKVDSKLTSFEFLLFFEPWVPVIDNNIVKGQLLELIKNVSFPMKPLVIGTLTEEAIFYVYEGWTQPITLSLYIEIILFTFHEHAFKVLERYPPSELDDQRPLISKIATQWVFACPTRIYARKAASYSYVFGFPLDFDGWENETFCNNHVCHAGELPYTFASAWVNFTDAGKRVATSMTNYWTNFAKTNDTNRPVAQSIVWPQMNTDESYLYFQDPLDIRAAYLKDDCDFWDKIGYKTIPSI
ncbi:unnamed protein product [Rotaria socialis]|uniref:Carboxylic ester hydrolase n=2 Tax=Rotaria socialis TaxID=392032 RepID=A0A821DY43_9BILA|nr:unnamed protein product [Rotaria socialis]CAF3260463.1 unnamed protein product [Rotaria socialis]CAF3443180.1 unnamed protein product [Rotaria socialis]CAF3526587.1 unnamed protein product [Rotaria socialis]CAF3753824.1 unnamed protein product [Rotaria socialis]